MHRRDFLATTLAFAAASGTAFARSRADTLMAVIADGPNSLDPAGMGVNLPCLGVTWNLYDRLIGFGIKPLPGGALTYDYDVLQPELAQSWEMAPDGRSVTFHLRPNATFHDGTPVTAADVKWSYDRTLAPLVQPFQNVAMRKDLSGYEYMFHRQIDFRPITLA